MEFFYPNLQNDMWRIFGWIFFSNKEYFLETDKKHFNKERIQEFLEKKGIALGDTALENGRDRASDSYARTVERVDERRLAARVGLITDGRAPRLIVLKV